MNVQNMAKQANFTHASEALDFLVNQAAKDNVTDEEAVREMAAYLRVKSEIQALQQQLSAAREALQAAEEYAEIGRKWRADSSLETWFPITAENYAAMEKRYTWASNELLACDYGDNARGVTGWTVYGWRFKGQCSIYGDSINQAIDSHLATLQRDRQP